MDNNLTDLDPVLFPSQEKTASPASAAAPVDKPANYNPADLSPGMFPDKDDSPPPPPPKAQSWLKSKLSDAKLASGMGDEPISQGDLMTIGGAGGFGMGLAEFLFNRKNPLQGATSGQAAKVSERLAALREAGAPASASQTPFERSTQGSNTQGTTGRQRQAGYNRTTADEARAARGQAPLNEFEGRRVQGVSPSGLAIPATEMDRLAKEAAQSEHATNIKNEEAALKRAIASDSPSKAAKVARFLGHIPGLSILAGTAAGSQLYDAMTRYEQGDTRGAVLSGLSGAGGLAALIPTPLTRFGGTAIGLGAEGLNQYFDGQK